jgi:hypothetical protein
VSDHCPHLRRAFSLRRSSGALCCIGGPALVYYLQPDPEELFERYNPELQKKALSEREQRLKNHQEFVHKLKEYAKSDKPSALPNPALACSFLRLTQSSMGCCGRSGG